MASAQLPLFPTDGTSYARLGAAGPLRTGRTALKSRFLQATAVVAATVVGGLVGLWLTDSEPSDYEATSLFVSTVDGPSAGVILNSYATMMGSPSFRDQLATTTGEPIGPASLDVSVPDSTGLIERDGQSRDP